MDACLHGGCLTVVAAEANDFHPLVAGRDLLEAVAAAVSGAVIDKDNLPRPLNAWQHRGKLLIQGRDVFQLVADWNDNGDSHSVAASKRAKWRRGVYARLPRWRMAIPCGKALA